MKSPRPSTSTLSLAFFVLGLLAFIAMTIYQRTSNNLLILVVLGLILLTLFSGLWVTSRLLKGSPARTREIIQQSIPDLPLSPDPTLWEKGWRRFLVNGLPILSLIVVLVVLILIFGIDGLEDIGNDINKRFDDIWPNAPAWVKELLIDLFITSTLFLMGIPLTLLAISRTPDREARQRIRNSILTSGSSLIALTIGRVFLNHGMEKMVEEGNPVRIVLGLMGTLLILFVVFLFLSQRLGFSGNAKIMAGRYDEVLARMDSIADTALVTNNALFLWSYGTMYMMAGRFEQAESLLRESITASENNPLFRANVYNALENLGTVLNGLERYDEAIQALEASIALKPNGSWAYIRLAESYLYQGLHADKALELLKIARKNKRLSPSDRFVRYEIRADQAWALTLLRQDMEARETLAKVLEKPPLKVIPIMAGLYWRAGEIHRLLKESKQAKYYFQKSLETDPTGAYSRRAKASLAKLEY